MTSIATIVKNPVLTYQQKVLALARAAENSIDVLRITPEVQRLRQQGIICDLFEGHAPYRPRYIVPDYAKFISQGSAFLELAPPQSLEDAVDNLLILYKHVPSITAFPVYIGALDTLLEPFVKEDSASYQTIKRFMRHIDRTITDSFCHANIGPQATVAGRMILKAAQELKAAVPNLTLRYDSSTDEGFATEAALTALITAKPSFANHTLYEADFAGDYAIVSCYNGLPVGGGSYTLVRLNLSKLAEQASDLAQFRNQLLPSVVGHMLSYLDERVRFIVEESSFFESSFLASEGLIDRAKFTAMFGVVGLAECVNRFVGQTESRSTRFGQSAEANDLGLEIIEELAKTVAAHSNAHLRASHGRYLLHAQVGIDTDTKTSPGCRIPIGDEPELYEHIVQSAPFHKYFPSGIGDVFSFDYTVKDNPKFVLDIVRGAFKRGLRYFSAYSSDSDVVRITGYLVKRSDMARLAMGAPVPNSAVVLGKGAVENQGVLKRSVRARVE